MSFGPHLTLDVYNCDPKDLANIEFMYSFLENLPKAIDMTPISQPQVFRYSGKVPEDWGLTGTLVIAESHLAFHTFPDKQTVFIDLFSCRDFDSDAVVEMIKELFNVLDRDIDPVLLRRGRRFPR